MRKRNFKGRCEKRSVPKCMDICRTYQTIPELVQAAKNQSVDVVEFLKDNITVVEVAV